MKIKLFIDRPILAGVISVVILILGLIGLSQLPVEQFPEIAPPTVSVSTSYTGANAETVLKSVVVPLEEALNGVENMMYMTSTATNTGSARITIYFRQGTDPDMATVNVQNRIATAQGLMPAEVTRSGINVRKRQTSNIKALALYSPDDSFDESFLNNYLKINIEPRLARIAGVGEVNVMGSDYSLRIWLDPNKMAQYGLIPSDITQVLDEQNLEAATGTLGAESNNTFQYVLKYRGRYEFEQDYENMVIRSLPNGEVLRLKDVATIELGSRTYTYIGEVNGRPGSNCMIAQTSGSNANEIIEQIDKEVAEITKNLPKGMEIADLMSSKDFLDASIKNVVKTLIEAIILVILVVYVFLQSLRSTFIPALSIIVSLVGTFAFLIAAGFSLNMLTLFALVLVIGTVVDDAIVVVEAVQVNIEKGLSAKQATVEAMHSVSSPIVATTVVLLAVFIPVSFMGSITGLLFQQFSISIAVSVCISSFNALTLSPALCALLLKPRPKVQKGFFAAFNRWFGKRTEEYTSATTRFIGHLKRTGGIVAVTLAAIAVIWHFLPSGFLPDEDQGYVMVFVQTPEASSLQTTVKAMQRVDELVRQRPDVEATSFAAGFNMLAGIASSNSGIIFVKLVDYSQRSKTSSQIASALTEELYVAVPEAVSYAFISPSIPGLGVTSGITLQVQDLEGRGTEFLADETMRFMDSLRKQPQIGSVTTQFNAGIPQRRIEVDKEKALAQGVPLRSFYKTMSTLLGGSYINNFNRFGKLYQTYIQAAPEYRRDKYSLESYFVDDGQGNSIPVSSFTTVRDTTGVEFVSQFNLYRSIELTVNPAAKVSTGQAMDAIEAVAADVLPEAVGTTWSGLSYQEKTASGSSGAVYLLAIVFVFLTLSALYNSWGLPLAILLSVPLAVLGALLFVGAAYLVSPEFINNIYMQISLVMLIGLSAKNAILVVEYADQLFFEKNMDLKAATIEAARLRMRPIMMTAFSFILGVMPLIFASGVYATARNIMGMALVGGMLLATMLGIFIYPALYYLVARVGKFERKRELKQKES